MSDLALGQRIGQGACSSVHRAKHRQTDEVYAVKMFNVYDDGQSRQLQREIAMLSTVQCDSLISLKGAFHDEGCVGIIIEYMDRGSLEFILQDLPPLDETALAGITYQILWGLGYLHYEKKIHRDIKPANILLNSLGQVKLSDFGISRDLEGTYAMSNTSVGSFRYMSPERLLGEAYDASGDIWSVGVLMIQLWTKQYPFGEEIMTPIDLYAELEGLKLDRMIDMMRISRPFADVLRAMLAPDPADRATCVELLEYPWFQRCNINTIRGAQDAVLLWLEDLDAASQGYNSQDGSRSGNNSTTNAACNHERGLQSTISSGVTGLSTVSSDCNEYDDDFEAETPRTNMSKSFSMSMSMSGSYQQEHMPLPQRYNNNGNARGGDDFGNDHSHDNGNRYGNGHGHDSYGNGGRGSGHGGEYKEQYSKAADDSRSYRYGPSVSSSGGTQSRYK